MENTVNQRIKLLMEYKKLNNNSFSKSIGVMPQTLHNIVSGKMHKPSYDVIQSIISNIPDINPEWLITGNGDMIKIDNNKDTIDISQKPTESRTSQMNEEWRATIEKMEAFYEKQVSVLQDALRASNEQNMKLTDMLGKHSVSSITLLVRKKFGRNSSLKKFAY